MKRSTFFIALSLLLPFAALAAVPITFPVNGGTGTGAKPTYGQLLVGNSSGVYTPTATSSLGITSLPFFASTTIGGGTATTGLTISGGATTTGGLINSGSADLVWGNGYIRSAGASKMDLSVNGTVAFVNNSNTTIFSATAALMTLPGGITIGGNFTAATGYVATQAVRDATATTKLDLTSNGFVDVVAGQSFRVANSNVVFNTTTNTATKTGIGTTTPFALLSVATPNGADGSLSTLFAIASSTTAGATTTLFSVDRAGNTNNAGTFKSVGAISTTGASVAITAAGDFITANYFRGINFVNRLALDNAVPGTSSSGAALLTNSTVTDFKILQFGCLTNLCPALQTDKTTTSVTVGLGDNSLGGRFGVGTSTPFAKMAIHADNGETNTTLFAIASSTATATSTLMSVSRNGAVTIASTTATLSDLGGALTVGSNGANGSTTIATGKMQWDGYNSAGTRICSFFVGTTLTTVTGACVQ